jgi:hypothetical protein
VWDQPNAFGAAPHGPLYSSQVLLPIHKL